MANDLEMRGGRGASTLLDTLDIKRNDENKSDIELLACFRNSCIHFNY